MILINECVICSKKIESNKTKNICNQQTICNNNKCLEKINWLPSYCFLCGKLFNVDEIRRNDNLCEFCFNKELEILLKLIKINLNYQKNDLEEWKIVLKKLINYPKFMKYIEDMQKYLNTIQNISIENQKKIIFYEKYCKNISYEKNAETFKEKEILNDIPWDLEEE